MQLLSHVTQTADMPVELSGRGMSCCVTCLPNVALQHFTKRCNKGKFTNFNNGKFVLGCWQYLNCQMSRHSSQYSKIFCFDVSGMQIITFNDLEGLLIFYVVQLSGFSCSLYSLSAVGRVLLWVYLF